MASERSKRRDLLACIFITKTCVFAMGSHLATTRRFDVDILSVRSSSDSSLEWSL